MDFGMRYSTPGALIGLALRDRGKESLLTRLQQKAAAIQRVQTGNQTELDTLLPAILDRAFKGEL